MGRDARANRRLDLAFGLDGKPLAATPDQVSAQIDGVWDDPNSKLVMAIAERGGELFIHIMGPPDIKTLETLEHAAQTYRNILYGPKDS
jgi:hypothetical protein